MVPAADTAQLTIAVSSLTLMVGGVLLLATLLRLGFLADFISAPVLTGFKAGIAIVIVVGQIPKLLGVHFDTAGFLQNVTNILRHLPDTSAATLVLGAALLGLIAGLETFLPRWPASCALSIRS